MEVSPDVLGTTPLAVLRNTTREAISNLLNPCKVLPSPSGYPRDFRGFVFLANVPSPPCKCEDPTGAVINSWVKANNPSVSDFLDVLQQIDRWDVIDDVRDFIDEDILEFNRRNTLVEKPHLIVSLNLESDKHILTIDDVRRIQEGLPPQNYDAFLLYSDDDASFANEMVEKLERQYQLKLCLKDRDLVGGVTFEHEAIMRLISERCTRLIIVVSPSFIESPANKFFVTYAQALGIEQRQRKIVPCIYKRVVLPPELSYYFVLDYTRSSPLWNFWDKLSQSTRAPLLAVNGPSRSSAVTITELPPEPLRLKPSEWDCPAKVTPSPLCRLPAIESGISTDDAEKPPTSQMSTTTDPSNVPKDKKKSKLTSLFTGLLTSPTDKPKKKRWFKRNKAKLLVSSE